MAIMEFVQRFQSLQIQRDTTEELIKVGVLNAVMGSKITSIGPFDIL